MPFEELIPRPFTSGAIRMHAPSVPGLYGISNSREWIFIGVANDIQSALLAHLGAPNTSLMKLAPSGFVYEICDGARCPARQDRLVLEYEPVCNRKPARQ